MICNNIFRCFVYTTCDYPCLTQCHSFHGNKAQVMHLRYLSRTTVYLRFSYSPPLHLRSFCVEMNGDLAIKCKGKKPYAIFYEIYWIIRDEKYVNEFSSD